jgi:hypothetical protein
VLREPKVARGARCARVRSTRLAVPRVLRGHSRCAVSWPGDRLAPFRPRELFSAKRLPVSRGHSGSIPGLVGLHGCDSWGSVSGCWGRWIDWTRIAPVQRSGARDLLQLVDSLGGFSALSCESIPELSRPRRRPPGCRSRNRLSYLKTVLAVPVAADQVAGRGRADLGNPACRSRAGCVTDAARGQHV